MAAIANSSANGVAEAEAPRSFSVLTVLVRFWMLVVSAWSLVGLVQLRAAAALIERESVALRRPITSEDHFAYLPELAAAFESAGLTHQGLIVWTLVLGLFAVTGLSLAAIGWIKQNDGQLSANLMMIGLWFLSAFVAVVNWDTLDLVSWLTN